MADKPTYEELERRVQDLQESEIYYRTLYESVNDAVLVHEIDFDGKPGKFIDVKGVTRDITERKLAEKALRESEEQYRSLFESIRDAILVTDMERNIINCNTAFCDLFGYTLDEIKGQKTRYVYKDDNEYEQMGRKLKKHMGGPNFLFTVHYKKKSGNIFPGETKNSPLPTGNERILVVDDEASIIRLEEALLKKLGYKVSSRTGSAD